MEIWWIVLGIWVLFVIGTVIASIITNNWVRHARLPIYLFILLFSPIYFWIILYAYFAEKTEFVREGEESIDKFIEECLQYNVKFECRDDAIQTMGYIMFILELTVFNLPELIDQLEKEEILIDTQVESEYKVMRFNAKILG